MKANRPQIERALKGSASDYRFFLFYGPDEASSRALARSLGEAMGAEAERVDLSGSELKSDPARLADEAASISLFGGARYVLVEASGDEIIAAIEALMEAPAAGNPVAVVAGMLKPASKLLKLALADPKVLAFASYVPEGRDAERLAIDLGRMRGLDLRPDVARRLADATGGNRALIEQELEKFALYLDAAPERPRPLDQDVLDLLGAGAEEGDLSRLAESVGSGNARALESELLRLSGEGINGIPLIRAVLRRMTLLSKLRAEVDQGKSVDAVMTSQGKSLFWKEKPAIGQQLERWRSPLLAKSIARLLDVEGQVKASGGPGPHAVDEELFAICRQAARLR